MQNLPHHDFKAGDIVKIVKVYGDDVLTCGTRGTIVCVGKNNRSLLINFGNISKYHSGWWIDCGLVEHAAQLTEEEKFWRKVK